jgi:hypothetical protein
MHGADTKVCLDNAERRKHKIELSMCAGEAGDPKDNEVEDDEGEVGASESGKSPSALCIALASGTDMSSTRDSTSNNRSQAVLQRWLDADCL